MLNSNKIEKLKNIIKTYISSAEMFDENYIFSLAKNYVKENQIEITKGEIKCIINNLINEITNSKKHLNIGENIYIII